MPIPKFNAYGLLPPGLHTSSLVEIEQSLAFSSKRQDMIETGLKPMIQSLLSIKISTIFIGGSFVTTKPSPNDIDGYVVTTLGSDAFQYIISTQERWRSRYRVDLHPALSDIGGYGSQAFWEEWFGNTKEIPPNAKGILKLVLRR